MYSQRVCYGHLGHLSSGLGAGWGSEAWPDAMRAALLEKASEGLPDLPSTEEQKDVVVDTMSACAAQPQSCHCDDLHPRFHVREVCVHELCGLNNL